MRPIDADALVAEQCGQCDGACEMFDGEKCLPCKADCHCDLREAIDNAPTLDLAPVVHGEWVKQKNGRLICPVCGVRGLQDSDELDYYYYPSAYCPNCGAKMDGGKRDD